MTRRTRAVSGGVIVALAIVVTRMQGLPPLVAVGAAAGAVGVFLLLSRRSA
ncbi:hypothetical protein ACFOYW_04510 [Gryllotalpicola reticulitermitis]|uniref:PEP-CTERM protein-sorting domain-containing protein n=1 Tax=Gryllotalpicola reticulitermitis TaxID=1184153 RepID=A0ABV8Q2X6_9MICO